MSGQTTVTINHRKAIAGMIADLRPLEVGSFKNEESAGVLEWGRFVKRGTANDQILLPTDNTVANILGPIVFETDKELAAGGSTVSIPTGDVLGVMRTGNIYVEIEDTVAADSGVFVRYAGKKQVQTLTFSGDLVTDNVVNGKVGGVAISPITFATSNAATMTALAAEIQSFAFVETAVSDGSNEITVTTVLDAADQNLSDFVVTLGAGQATATEAETVAAVNSSERGMARSDADSTSAVEVDWAYEEAGVAGDIVKIRKK